MGFELEGAEGYKVIVWARISSLEKKASVPVCVLGLSCLALPVFSATLPFCQCWYKESPLCHGHCVPRC